MDRETEIERDSACGQGTQGLGGIVKWRWCHLLVVIDGVPGLQTRWASLHTPGVEMVLNVRGDVRAGLLRSYAATRKRV